MLTNDNEIPHFEKQLVQVEQHTNLIKVSKMAKYGLE